MSGIGWLARVVNQTQPEWVGLLLILAGFALCCGGCAVMYGLLRRAGFSRRPSSFGNYAIGGAVVSAILALILMFG